MPPSLWLPTCVLDGHLGGPLPPSGFPAADYEESVEQYVRRNLGEEVFERLIEPFCRRVACLVCQRVHGAGLRGWECDMSRWMGVRHEPLGVHLTSAGAGRMCVSAAANPVSPSCTALQRRVRGRPQEAVHEGCLRQGAASSLPCAVLRPTLARQQRTLAVRHMCAPAPSCCCCCLS